MGEYTAWEIFIILILVAVIFGITYWLRFIKYLLATLRGKGNHAKQEEHP
ncbi:MAG: hypothetical protein LBU69_04740 [Deltaproteobacteria bacterium]|nr:hypothetical protein [Deltaproteobacteria bacterium]